MTKIFDLIEQRKKIARAQEILASDQGPSILRLAVAIEALGSENEAKITADVAAAVEAQVSDLSSRIRRYLNDPAVLEELRRAPGVIDGLRLAGFKILLVDAPAM